MHIVTEFCNNNFEGKILFRDIVLANKLTKNNFNELSKILIDLYVLLKLFIIKAQLIYFVETEFL
ncbi:hypothetical protein T05_5030 [Trichinella murrelli]|uniref:Uncharacterized protein n=1 Tax=Trichinella murrelli TaxID=144512 RepID=A0A0V0UF40_9BILA|nr:hypothetical protein T05_5030 [Trichinella murrelli]